MVDAIGDQDDGSGERVSGVPAAATAKSSETTSGECVRRRERNARYGKTHRIKLKLNPIALSDLKLKRSKRAKKEREKRKLDPVADAESKRKRNERSKVLRMKIMTDPVAHAEFRQKVNERRNALRAEKKAADPIAYADMNHRRRKERWEQCKVGRNTEAELERKRTERAVIDKRRLDPVAHAEFRRKKNERRNALNAERKAANPIAHAEQLRERYERAKEVRQDKKEKNEDR